MTRDSHAFQDRVARALPMLTSSHRDLASYVLANPLRAATMRIDELAAAVAVSIATANRFTRALGFDSYAAFRAALVRQLEASLAPAARPRDAPAHTATAADMLRDSLDESARHLDATRRVLDPDAGVRAVAAIRSARRVFVVGSGASGFLAGLLQHGLEAACPVVTAVATAGGPSHAARQLSKARHQDLVIALAFPRYATDTVELARLGKTHGAPLLALTDGPASPLAPLADIALYAQSGEAGMTGVAASALALIEALCRAAAHEARGADVGMAEPEHPWMFLRPA